MKAILYCRVSYEEQAKGFSLESQEIDGLAYAEKNQIQIAKIFRAAESASHEGREVFNDAIQYLKSSRDIQILLVYKMDRAIRNYGDMAMLNDLAHQGNKQIHFYHEGWTYTKDSSIADFYRFGFMSVVASGFSKNLSDITKVGLRKKAENGQFPGLAPFGYKNNKETHLVEVDPHQAEWAIKIKKLAATGMTLEKIQQTILKEGCPYTLVSSKLERLIKSIFYHGLFEWNGQTYSGKHKPLIDVNLHNAAVAGLCRLNKPRGRHQLIAYRGLMTCDFCGCAITGERKKMFYVYYRCTWRKGRCENTEYTVQKDLDIQFEQILENIRIDQDRAQALLMELEKNSGQEAVLRESRIAFLRQEYQRVQKRLEGAYEDKLDGKLEEIQWVKKSGEWQGKLLELESQIKRLESSDQRDSLRTLKRVLELSNLLKSQFKILPEEKRGEILKYVCSNLRLRHKTVLFSYAKPFDLFAETVTSGNWGHGSNADSRNSTTFSEVFDLEANQLDALCLVDETHFVCAMGPDGRKQFRFTDKLDPIHSQRYAWPRLPYIQVLLKQAYELQKRMESSPDLTQTTLAEELGMSRVQVTQILGLLRLAPEIQQHILSLSPTEVNYPIPKHVLMRLSGNADPKTQLKEFKRLLQASGAVA